MDPIVLNIAGHPQAQPRPRFVGKGRVVGTASAAAKRWRAAIVAAGRQAVLERGACNAPSGYSVEIAFRFPHEDPAEHGRVHLRKPDLDNLVKLVLDALVEAGVMASDDAAVASLSAWKRWGATGGVSVVLSPLDAQISGPSVDDLGRVSAGDAPAWLGGRPNASSDC